MAGKPKFDYEQVAELLIKNFGNKTATAQQLSCDRHTISAYCDKYATCLDALETARNRWLDMAENRLAQKVEADLNQHDTLVYALRARQQRCGKTQCINEQWVG